LDRDVFPVVLQRFDAFLQATGRAARTRSAYRRQLVVFFADTFVEPQHASEDDVVAYLASLPANGSRRPDAIRALRAFWRWYEPHVDRNPVERVRTPRKRVPDAPEIDRAALRSIFRAAFRRERRRGWAIMLAYATGARRASLVALTVEDVRGDRVRFEVAKGNRPYSVRLGRMARIAARHLVQDARSAGRPTLLGVGGERFRQWVEQASHDAGYHAWPHLLRHAFGTQLARRTDPDTWRRAMGHADLSQYPRYVHPERAREAEALEEFNL
jgi:site-specific recombinase XerD